MSVQWMLVAHAAGARIFERKNLGEWRIIREIDHPEGRMMTPELVSDRSGRGRKGAGGPIVTLDGEHSPRAAELDRFVHRLVQELDSGSFDGLILTAPPQMLGKLRHAVLPKHGHRLLASFGKDYAHADDRVAVGAVEALLRVSEPTATW